MTDHLKTIRSALEAAKHNTTHGQIAHNCKEALAALAELERTHYTAADMADASAQGFRDGVASVTAGQEPVAWMYDWLPAGGPTAYDWISWSKDEVFAPENCHFNIRPLYAAPVAQQSLITIEDSLRFRLDCTKERLEAAERECSELRAKLKAQQPQAEAVPSPDGGAGFIGGIWHEPAPQQAEAAPPGYVLVPVEPTDEMEVAAENAYESQGWPFPNWKTAYRAMIAAAPKGQP